MNWTGSIRTTLVSSMFQSCSSGNFSGLYSNGLYRDSTGGKKHPSPHQALVLKQVWEMFWGVRRLSFPLMCFSSHQSLFSSAPFEGGRAANGKLRPLGGGQLLCMGLRLRIQVTDLLIKVGTVCGECKHTGLALRFLLRLVDTLAPLWLPVVLPLPEFLWLLVGWESCSELSIPRASDAWAFLSNHGLGAEAQHWTIYNSWWISGYLD